MFDENNKIHITDIRFFDHWSKTGKKNQIAEQTLLAEKNIYSAEPPKVYLWVSATLNTLSVLAAVL